MIINEGPRGESKKMQEIGETFVGMTALQMPDIDKLPAFQVWFPRDPRAPTAKKCPQSAMRAEI